MVVIEPYGHVRVKDVSRKMAIARAQQPSIIVLEGPIRDNIFLAGRPVRPEPQGRVLCSSDAALAALALLPITSLIFASKKLLEADQQIVNVGLAELSAVDDWAKGDIHAVAEELAPAIGLSVSVVEVALKRQSYGIKTISDAVIADQQQELRIGGGDMTSRGPTGVVAYWRNTAET
ncbi:hypothetical protein ACM41_13110 [Bradyrhizobium sp. CCBAU 21362]|uniref:hypothetical protein n=1 Tax=Bradyrhizobium sp. CCBAU 21362 TaxID=1325082 RepID=UPI0023061F26|nr:hypothetical protein [Bradyrhizobium sp. CCBAU 21362]MDA9537138.1 hypothetical protein [Bradyrhizobium sp. CCBAU 21362]